MPKQLDLTSDSPKITKCHGFLAILTAGPEVFWTSCVPKHWVAQQNCLRHGFLGFSNTAPATTHFQTYRSWGTKKQRLHCTHTTKNATTAESKILKTSFLQPVDDLRRTWALRDHETDTPQHVRSQRFKNPARSLYENSAFYVPTYLPKTQSSITKSDTDCTCHEKSFLHFF